MFNLYFFCTHRGWLFFFVLLNIGTTQVVRPMGLHDLNSDKRGMSTRITCENIPNILINIKFKY